MKTDLKSKRGLVIASIAIFFYYLFVEKISTADATLNIKLYILSLAVFAGIYLISSYVCSKIFLPDIVLKLAAVVTAIAGIAWFVGTYLTYEGLDYLCYNMPTWLYVFILLTGLTVTYSFLKSSESSTNILFRAAFGSLIVVLESVFLYAPGILGDLGGGGDIQHGSIC